MEVTEAMQKRRSIRAYNGQPVGEADLRALIEAALSAPSWKNTEVTRYYVACGETMRQASEEALPEGNQKKTKGASALIVSTIVPNIAGYKTDGEPDNELGNGWGIYDCGLQNMSLLLKATDLGLSTLVMGLRDAKRLKEILKIPEEEVVIAAIAVGYSDAEPECPKRKSVEEVAKFL